MALEPVVLFTTLGPNPAPLAELFWALARHHRKLVVEAHVVVATRGAFYLERELLAQGGPLEQLVALLGDDLAHGPRLHVHKACIPDGTPLVDDDDPLHTQAYQTAVWNAASAARKAAADRPVIFALASGRRRTMVAFVTMAYQMLAGPHDICVDVRVDDPRAEGGSGFFFPEQTPSRLVWRGEELDARQVDVRLVHVSLPRLRGLTRPGDLASPEDALAATQSAVDRAEVPSLRVDLERGVCFVNERRLPLGASQFVWYATLAIERRLGGEGWTSADSPTQAAILQGSPAPGWRDLEGLAVYYQRIAKRLSLMNTLGMDPALRTLRSKTRDAVRSFCHEHMPMHEPLLVPTIKIVAKGIRKQRLELPSDHIEINDPHGWVEKPRQR